jgi:hypothetical protein
MSTENYESAMEGLRMTRDYRSLTYFLRITSRLFSRYTFDPLERFGVLIGLIGTEQKTLLWTRDYKWNPSVLPQKVDHPTAGPSARPTGSPSIAVTDHSFTAPLTNKRPQNTPTMPFSGFPLARTTNHTDHESDIPLHELMRPTLRRDQSSDELTSPLVERPLEVHGLRTASASSGGHRISGETRRSSESERGRSSAENLLSSALPGDEGNGVIVWAQEDFALHNRQSYRRPNSDSALPPFDFIANAEQSGLGINLKAQTSTLQR